MATKVSSGEITIVDVNDGGSFYTATVYAQQVGQPDTPSGGSYNFSTQVLTVPTDPNPATNPSTGATIWSASIPTSTTTPTWAATYTFSIIPPNTSSTGGTWGTPVLFVVNGTNGTNGTNGISAILSNESFTFPATSTGVVGSYTGSGTNVYVYEGATQLSYDGVGTSAGTWTVTSTATNITRGSLTDSGTYLTVGDHSGVANNIDTSSITYTITGKSASNTAFTIVKSQTFSKSKAGTDGQSGLGSTVSITSNREVSFTATDGTIDAGQADIIFTANIINMTSPIYSWTFSGFQTAPSNSGTSSQTISATHFGTSKSAKVTVTVTYNSQTYTDDYTIVRLEKSSAAAGATVGATWGTNISGQPSNDLMFNNLQTDTWIVGQTPPWLFIGAATENSIEYDTNQTGTRVPVWKCTSNGDNAADGGWNADANAGKNWFKVDKNKSYRFAVPVKITSGTTGSYYWGIGGDTVCALNTSNKDSNPYFVYGQRVGLVANRWYLLVGYVFPAGSTGNTNAGSGIFDLTTGELIAERWNYCWASDVEYTGTRAYQFYCGTAGETQVFGYPVVEVVDGTESKLFDNLGYSALLNAQQKWSDVQNNDGKRPADYADVTNYNDTRVSNVIEENSTLFVARPIGASYNSNQGAVTGMIRIILPQGFTDTMMKFTVNVYTYSSDKSFSLNLAGYNYQDNGTWYNTEANLIGSTAADNRVRFGYDSTLGKCCIYIGEPTSSWSYPKVMVKDFIAGYSNFARSVWETGWVIDIVTSTPQLVTQDYADALIDAASIRNQGSLATKSNVDYSSEITNLPGLGVNRLVNTDFKGITGWFQGWNPGGANIVNFNDSTTIWGVDAYWRPKGGNALAIEQDGIGSNDIAIDIYNGGTWGTNDQRIAVKPNTKYEFSARIAAHRCIGIEMYVAVYNSNGDNISNWSLPYSSWYVPATGGTDLSNYTQYSIFFISDPTAAYVQPYFRKGNTQAGQADSWMWITQPYFGEAAPSQTTASAYVPGAPAGAFANLNQINSTNVITYIANAAINSAQIENAAITQAKIGDAAIGNAQIDRASVNKLKVVTADIVDASVETLKIAGNAVTVPMNAYTISSIGLVKGIWTTVQTLTIPVLSTTETTSLIIPFGLCYTVDYGPFIVRLLSGDIVLYEAWWLNGYSFAGGLQGNANINYTLPANTSKTLTLSVLTNGDYNGNADNRYISCLGARR